MRQDGYTYLFLLGFVALTGVALTVVAESAGTRAQREKEAQLLWVGAAYRTAIGRFYESTPGPAKRYPTTLADLLADPRFPVVRRHLRFPYPDPMTGNADWELIPSPDGGFMGVASRSRGAPLKRAGFQGRNQVFEEVSRLREESMRYRDWEFVHSPGSPAE